MSGRKKVKMVVMSLVVMSLMVLNLGTDSMPATSFAAEKNGVLNAETSRETGALELEMENTTEVQETKASATEEPEIVSTEKKVTEPDTTEKLTEEATEKEDTEPSGGAEKPAEEAEETKTDLSEVTTEKETEESETTERTTEEVTEKETEKSSTAEKEADKETTEKESNKPDAGDDNAPKKENVEKKTIRIDRNKPEDSAVSVTVPIYNYDIVDVVVPTTYAVALNPYGFPVKTGEDAVSTEQVVSRNYGIINKSSTDKIVTVTFTVEDLNEGKIVFADSADAVANADKDTYAVYLAAVPAKNGEIKVDGADINKDTTAAALSDVSMTGAENKAVALQTGTNKIAFKLAKADYRFEDGENITLGDDGVENLFELTGLDPDGAGVTAFTFCGTINKSADWSKLPYGIKLTAVYSYENATGEEVIVDGTGAMIDLD